MTLPPYGALVCARVCVCVLCVCVCVCVWVGGWGGGCACVHVLTASCDKAFLGKYTR